MHPGFLRSQNMAMIGSGLAANTSDGLYDLCPLIIASQFKNKLQRLDLSYQYTFMQDDIGMDLAAALRHLQLKSLNLSCRELDMESWTVIFDTVLTPTGKLEKFIMKEAVFIGDPLKSLGEYMKIAKSLKALDLTRGTQKRQ